MLIYIYAYIYIVIRVRVYIYRFIYINSDDGHIMQRIPNDMICVHEHRVQPQV